MEVESKGAWALSKNAKTLKKPIKKGLTTSLINGRIFHTLTNTDNVPT